MATPSSSSSSKKETSSKSRPTVQAPKPAATSAPDLSWFCCYHCSRRPIPEASFSMLLTTCSHIVCSSCWDTSRGLSGNCPCCGVHANTLNLTTTRPTPKQLMPYFKSPEELLTNMLSAVKFQEHQKRQCLARRKKAWVLINHSRAKEDYEKEYAECKKMQQELNKKKNTLRAIFEILHKKGIDPVQKLKGVFPESLLEAVFKSMARQDSGATPTPLSTTPQVGAPPATSTPAIPQGHPPGVEFAPPKKLPHTMRGSVTSLTVRRSPSNPPTPVSLLQPFAGDAAGPSSLPAKRPRMMTTPPQNQIPSKQQIVTSQRVSVRPQPMQVGRFQGPTPVSSPHRGASKVLTPAGGSAPLRPSEMSAKMQSLTLRPPHRQLSNGQPRQPGVRSGRHTPQSNSGQPIQQYSGQPVQQYSGQPVQQYSVPQSQPVRPTPQSVRPNQQFGQPVRQYNIPQSQLGQPTPQSDRPNQQFGRPVQQYSIPQSQPGRPIQQSARGALMRSGRPIPPPGRPEAQQLGPHHPVRHSTPQQYAQHQMYQPSDSVHRIRAVPPSSTAPPRMFPSPTPSQISQRSRRSQGSPGSSQAQPPRVHTPTSNHPESRGSPRITIGPPPSLRPLSQAVSQFHSSWSKNSSSSSSSASSPRVRAKTPTNPSPLLTSFTTPSPWQQGQRSQGSSPWNQGHTPLPGSRLSGSGKRHRLTPVKT